jgi:tetratricopeptide (TPR) repeat protein
VNPPVDPIQDLLQGLEKARGDTRAQAALTAEFLVFARPEAEQKPLRAALDSAAVLHWFDPELLGKVLSIPDEDAQFWCRTLTEHSFVEHYRGESDLHYNLHETIRLGWRIRFAGERPERFRALSLRASSCFADNPTPRDRIEWIYQLLCGDPDKGATELARLDRQWTESARPEDRYSFATALQELLDTDLVNGRARACCLLFIAWTRDDRGETSQLAGLAEEALQLARQAGDEPTEAESLSLAGAVSEAQGKLDAARGAFAHSLAICKRMAERNPSDGDWQRYLAIMHVKVGDVWAAEGRLTEALASFRESLDISQRLAQRDPANAGWRRNLAVAHSRVGGLLEAQGRLEGAQAAFEQYLSISRRLAEEDPSNALWQRELGVAHSRLGAVLRAQGRLEGAQTAFDQNLAIFRRLTEQDPSNARWQRDLAVAHSRVGDVLQAQGRLEAAQAAFEQTLSISWRLAAQDPSNAGSQRELAVAHSRVGGVLQAQGKLAEAIAAFGENLTICRRLTEQDPSNADWQRDLAVACLRIGRIAVAAKLKDVGLPLYEESLRIFAALVQRAPGVVQWAEDMKIVETELTELRADIASSPDGAADGGQTP